MPDPLAAQRAVALVVEDEALVRMVNADILDDAGFLVLEAANADDALRLFEAEPAIALVVTDIEMPGSMNGLDLAHRLFERRPTMPVIVISGRMRPDPASLPPVTRFVPKPYAPNVLLRAVEEVMGGGA